MNKREEMDRLSDKLEKGEPLTDEEWDFFYLSILPDFEEVYTPELDSRSIEWCRLANIIVMLTRECESCGPAPVDKARYHFPDSETEMHKLAVELMRYRDSIVMVNKYRPNPVVIDFIKEILTSIDIWNLTKNEIKLGRDLGLFDTTLKEWRELKHLHPQNHNVQFKEWAYEWAEYFDSVAGSRYVVTHDENMVDTYMCDTETGETVQTRRQPGDEYDARIAIGAAFAHITGNYWLYPLSVRATRILMSKGE